jgi:hypothetical protein
MPDVRDNLAEWKWGRNAIFKEEKLGEQLSVVMKRKEDKNLLALQ